MPKNKADGTFNVLQHNLNNTRIKITHFFVNFIYLCMNIFVLTARLYKPLLL